MDEIKLCKDCIYFKYKKFCYRNTDTIYDLVYGTHGFRIFLCIQERNDHIIPGNTTKCGSRGAYFKAKTEAEDGK